MTFRSCRTASTTFPVPASPLVLIYCNKSVQLSISIEVKEE